MSGPVVVIGYLILIPSILGTLLGLLLLFATGAGSTKTFAQIDSQARTSLQSAGVPSDITDKVLAGGSINESELQSLSRQQKAAVQEAQLSIGAGKVGAGAGTAIAGGLAIFIMVSSFVGGVLGWVLIMKKRILQCTQCGAAISAS